MARPERMLYGIFQGVGAIYAVIYHLWLISNETYYYYYYILHIAPRKCVENVYAERKWFIQLPNEC